MQYGTVCRNRMFVTEDGDQISNAVLGLTGEAGEIADHPRNPTKADLRKEIGDVLWYLAALNEIEFGDSLLDVAKENIQKLRGRWPEKYNNVDIEELTL